MDMYSNATAWLSHQQQQNQHVHEPQHVLPDARPPSADAWKERAGGVAASSALDLSDFGLGDIPGEQRLYKRPLWEPCSSSMAQSLAHWRMLLAAQSTYSRR